MADDDFYLLVPEDEWVEERLSRRRSWDDREGIEQQSPHRRPGRPLMAGGTSGRGWRSCSGRRSVSGRGPIRSSVEPVPRCSFGCAGATASAGTSERLRRNPAQPSIGC